MFVFLALSCIGIVASYPTGAPESACDDMMPEHNSAAQTGQSSFMIQVLAPSEKCKRSFKVTLAGLANFRGFLCQPRITVNSNKTSGTFTPLGASSLMKDACLSSTALTHTSNAPKTSIEFEWTPVGVQPVYIVCTIVEKFDKIWHMQKSELVTPNPTDPTCATIKPETATTQPSRTTLSTRTANPRTESTTKTPHAGATRLVVPSTLLVLMAVIIH